MENLTFVGLSTAFATPPFIHIDTGFFLFRRYLPANIVCTVKMAQPSSKPNFKIAPASFAFIGLNPIPIEVTRKIPARSMPVVYAVS